MQNKLMTMAIMLNTFFNTGVAYLTQPWWVQATANLFNAAMGILIFLSGCGAVLLAVWRGICWYKANENERPVEQKKLITVIVGAIGVIIGESVFTWILSFYINANPTP